MKKYLIPILILSYSCKSALCQNNELTELKKNKSLIYSTAESYKSQGLKASIKYPTNYTANEHKHPNTLQGFSNINEYIIYNLAINAQAEKFESPFISEINLKERISIASPEARFLEYKSGFKINGNQSAYIDFTTIISNEFFTYCRFYFIIYENYLIGINFSMAQKNDESKKQLLLRFKNYHTFFQEFSKTFKVE